MSRKYVFENMGTGFSSLEILPGTRMRITRRSAEILRFEIPRNVLTVNHNLHFGRLTVNYNLFDG